MPISNAGHSLYPLSLLLWHASSVATGYLILNHRPVTQLARLVAVLRRQQPQSPILVHHDRFRCDLDRGDLDRHGVDVMTSPSPLEWGGFGMVEAVWNGLRKLAVLPDVDWVVVLSGQDYPVKPLAAFEATLRSIGVDAMFEATRVSELAPQQRHDLEYRYLYQYRHQAAAPPEIVQLFPSALRRTARAVSDVSSYVINHAQSFLHLYRYPPPMPRRLGWRARHTPFSESTPCWHSSSWMALSRRGFVRLLEFIDSHPEFVDYYRHTPSPDESAIATILCNDPDIRVRREPLTLARWTHPESGHPEVLRIWDLPFINSRPQFFARKFDIAVDTTVLDALDDLLERAIEVGTSGSGARGKPSGPV